MMIFSAKHPSQLLGLTYTEISNSSQHEISRLAGLDYNLLIKGYKPRLIQTSPMFNTISKLRGCQFLNLFNEKNQPYSLIFTCDSVGGLYASVTNKDHIQSIDYIKQPIQSQRDLIIKMRK